MILCCNKLYNVSVLLIVRLSKVSLFNDIISNATLCSDKLMITIDDDVLLHCLIALFQILLCVTGHAGE
jgi:hypothetical protein